MATEPIYHNSLIKIANYIYYIISMMVMNIFRLVEASQSIDLGRSSVLACEIRR
jgi:hypothetical protein